MLAKSIAAFAALTLATAVAAEPVPYKPSNMRTSVRSLFGVVRRQENTPGYQPEPAMCNAGATCAEACGAGYETCSSNDDEVHCFNPTVGEICCPDLSGSSCEAGYYCTADKAGETWCCPESMDLETCAKAYKIDGGLVKQTPPAVTSTSTSSSSSTTEAPSTSTTSTSTEEESTETETSTSRPSLLPSSTYVRPNATSISSGSPAQPTESAVPTGGAGVVGPASALILVAAGVVALL